SLILADSRHASSVFTPGGAYNLSENGYLRAPNIRVGYDSNGYGGVYLCGGKVDSDNMYVGINGVGVFNQSGGINAVDRLTIGTNLLSPPPGTDQYNMSGGSLNSGYTDVARNGVFTLTRGAPWLGHLPLYNNGRIDISGPNHPVLKTYTMHFYSNDAAIDVRDNSME